MNNENLTLAINMLITLISLAVVGFIIYIIVKYANTPLNELPTWVWWLLH